MKDILQSKVMIGFIIFVLAFTYMNASLEQKKNDSVPANQMSQNEISQN